MSVPGQRNRREGGGKSPKMVPIAIQLIVLSSRHTPH